jgi:anti-repressor protein
MNDIIQSTMVYKTEKGTPVTDSLKVARVFGKQHKNVMQQVRNLLGSAENSAHKNWFYKSTYLDAQGKQQPLFVMNRDGFSLLAMSLTGEKALQFKVAFIDLFDKMEKAIAGVQTTTPAIPKTFAEALRLAASQQEQIEEQQRLIEAKEKQIEESAPRVLFSQAVESAESSILIGELAKILCQNGIAIGEKRLFQWMRENEYLCSFGERYNQPTQRATEMGLFEMRKVTIQVGSATKVRTTTKVTGKGQVYFVNKFLYEQQNVKP